MIKKNAADFLSSQVRFIENEYELFLKYLKKKQTKTKQIKMKIQCHMGLGFYKN